MLKMGIMKMEEEEIDYDATKQKDIHNKQPLNIIVREKLIALEKNNEIMQQKIDGLNKTLVQNQIDIISLKTSTYLPDRANTLLEIDIPWYIEELEISGRKANSLLSLKYSSDTYSMTIEKELDKIRIDMATIAKKLEPCLGHDEIPSNMYTLIHFLIQYYDHTITNPK